MCYHIAYYNKYNGKIVFLCESWITIHIHTAFTRLNASEVRKKLFENEYVLQ